MNRNYIRTTEPACFLRPLAPAETSTREYIPRVLLCPLHPDFSHNFEPRAHCQAVSRHRPWMHQNAAAQQNTSIEEMTREEFRTPGQSITSLFSAFDISTLTSQLRFLSPIHTVYTAVHTKQCSWTLQTIQFTNTLFHPLREDVRISVRQTQHCATGSYRDSINALKNPHRKILENTSFFFFSR